LIGRELGAKIIQAAVQKISKEELLGLLPFDVQNQPELRRKFILDAREARDNLELQYALALCNLFGYPDDLSMLFAELINEDWHIKHEELAMKLEGYRDPATVDLIYEASEKSFPYMWDEGHAFARKCTWALARIGTPEAYEKLRLLTHSKTEEIRGYAIKRLADAGSPVE
jgi:hypothetical protein